MQQFIDKMHLIVNHCCMKKSLFLIISLALTISCNKSLIETPTGSEVSDPIVINLNAADKSIAETGNTLTFNLLGRILNEKEGNIMISPYSLSACLSMTANGAKGATQDSMLKALGFEGKTMAQVNDYFYRITESILKTDPSTKLSIANSIWYRNTISVKNEFIQNTSTFFKATVKALDFNSKASVGTINKWAYDNTNGLIPTVLNDIQPLDIMFLLNAVYFKSEWAKGYGFDADKTVSLQFTKRDKVVTNVPMMTNNGKYNCLINNNINIVTIPYGNGAFEFVAFLPSENSSLSKMTTDLVDSTYFSTLMSQLYEQNILLKLPKFKFKFESFFNDILCDMGMSIAFEAYKADFSNAFNGISDAYISFVKQNNFIELNENGTEAAAVTTTGVGATSAPTPPTIQFNRPFVFIIREKATGIILFAGKIEDPNLTE